jgi:hypothetical protein
LLRLTIGDSYSDAGAAARRTLQQHISEVEAVCDVLYDSLVGWFGGLVVVQCQTEAKAIAKMKAKGYSK